MLETEASHHSPVRAAVAAFLVALLLIGCVTGLARYLSSREHQLDQLDTLAKVADTLAAEGQALSSEAIRQGLAPGVAAVDVISSGATDAFGIARGAEVSETYRATDNAPPAIDAAALQALQVRMAALAQAVEPIPRLRYEATEHDDGGVLLAAHALVAEPAEGLVRVAGWQPVPPDPVPWWRLFLALIAASALAFFIPERGLWTRSVVALGVAFAAASVGVGRGWLFGGLSACVVGPVAWLLWRPLADLLRGLKEQPGTYVYVLPAVLATVADTGPCVGPEGLPGALLKKRVLTVCRDV